MRDAGVLVGDGLGEPAVLFVAPFPSRPAIAERLAGAQEVLRDSGLRVVIADISEATDRQRWLGLLGAVPTLAGALLCAVETTPEEAALLSLSRLPLVALDVGIKGLPSTVVNDVLAGRLATEHLLALGHRRIGFLSEGGSGEPALRSARRRMAGHLEALAVAGIAIERGLVRYGGTSMEDAVKAATTLLCQSRPPTAIATASDVAAAGALFAAQALRIPVPGQLSIVGNDGLAQTARLLLTTVRHPLREGGRLAAERLLALGKGLPVRPRHQVLEVTLAQGATTAPVHQSRDGGRPPLDWSSIVQGAC
ncbi:MAG: LacI family transcriptional regulator [Acidimicrobiaceae bacterium]|nr:LacI family transcriptional regulator [Acidimicrobiaceae bacterium]